MDTPADLGILEGVPLVLEADLGSRTISLGDLLELEVGSIIRLGERAGAPFSVYAGGSPIARARAALADGLKGVRLTEVDDVQ